MELGCSGGLSLNQSITQDFIERHLDKPWNWGELGLRIVRLGISI